MNLERSDGGERTVDHIEDCPDCVPCRRHRGTTEEATDDDDDPEHDPADCGCNVAKPCAACRLVSERDALRAQLAVFTRAAAALIQRNGYCVACERYAPFHLIDCPMGHVNN